MRLVPCQPTFRVPRYGSSGESEPALGVAGDRRKQLVPPAGQVARVIMPVDTVHQAKELAIVALLDKAKGAAKTVGEKAQEGIKTGQKKIDETKTKRHINDLNRKLGGIVYLQRTGKPPANADTEIERLVGEITKAHAHPEE